MTLHPSATDDHDGPTALIEAQDQQFVSPLREYLETHGCAVDAAPEGQRQYRYRIIVGGLDFVKEMLAHDQRAVDKTLLLLWDGGPEQLKPLLLPPRTRIVYIDPVPASQTDVHTWFSFFFVGNQTEKNLRSGTSPPPTSKPAAPQTEDRVRIAQTIAEVFGPKPSVKPKAAGSHKHQHPLKRWGRPIGVGLFLLTVPIAWYVLTLTLSVVGLALSAQVLQSGNERVAAQTLVVTQWSLGQSRLIYPVASWPLLLVGAHNAVVRGERIGTLLEQSAQALARARILAVRGNAFAKIFLAPLSGTENNTTSPLVDVIGIRNELFSLLTTMGLAQAELERLVDERAFPFSYIAVHQSAQRMLGSLSTYRRRMGDIYTMLTLYPHAGGFREKRTYLVLLQNSMELRPTGGFIGSLAVVTVAEGKIGSIDVQDVYTVDGQLKGHVDPPGPVAELLGQEHWYLRDSNWDPDFTVSAARAAWFYEKETGTRVDGVVGLSLPMVAELLGVTGPIDLPDENDRITRDNFFAKSLYYTQHDFFPGSTQKKDFLGSLSRSLVGKVLDSKSISPLVLFRVISAALERHDLLFYFPDPILSELVLQAGWSGKVPALSGCQLQRASSCVGDYWYTAEANVGVNKANYFIQRSDSQTIHIAEDGTIEEQTTLVYRNTAPVAMADHGVYKAYVQFMVPADAALVEVTLDGAVVPTRDKKAKGPLLLPYEEPLGIAGGVDRTGIAFAVAPGEQKTLGVRYRRGEKLVIDGTGTYALVIQKQPGMSSQGLEVRINYPIFWNATQQTDRGRGVLLSGTEAFLAKEGSLVYNTVITHDAVIIVTFSK